MTPEELDRTVEFLVRHSADFAVRFERDHEILTEFMTNVVDLTQLQSRRLDRYDEWLEETRKESQRSQKRNEDFQRDALLLLNRILDRLTPAQNIQSGSVF